MHNFSSMVKYLLVTHMKQNLIVKNLDITSCNKEKEYERHLEARSNGPFSPSYPDQVTVNSLWDI